MICDSGGSGNGSGGSGGSGGGCCRKVPKQPRKMQAHLYGAKMIFQTLQPSIGAEGAEAVRLTIIMKRRERERERGVSTPRPPWFGCHAPADIQGLLESGSQYVD